MRTLGQTGAEPLLDELKRYVGFGAADEAALRALQPVVEPHIESIVDLFYDRILQHSEAKKALVGGESQVGHLKVTLRAWLRGLLAGPWDEAYYERRARIGRVHVRIALPQHYMFGAMNILRTELNRVLDQSSLAPQARADSAISLGRVLDLELAIMLHTYREDLLAQQAKSERLATFGQLVASIGHELRNPLGVIETSLFVLKGKVGGDEKVAKHLGRIGDQVKLSNDIIRRLLDMIGDRPVQRETVDLQSLFDGLVGTVSVAPGVKLVVRGLDGPRSVQADPVQLRQVFVNLVENALHAVGPSGEVRVTVDERPGGTVFAVDDSGPGVAPSVRARLFEPLVTTKSHGIGLGLALVRRIVERHEGTISVGTSELGGARFEVTLPKVG